MIKFALDYRSTFNKISDQSLSLRPYELSRVEWRIVEDLCEVLKIFKDATLFFSRNGANIAMVIPAMDHLDSHLINAVSNLKYSITMKAALSIGKKTLNRYYDKTDHSEVFRIEKVLHPRHKLQYFKNANWLLEWIDTAKDIVCEEFEHSYASADVEE
ncbi:hypothetical protein K443DRAFT_76968, partial [Laccaria amethystina LaAM-08-1]